MISYFKELIKSIAKCAITVLFVTMFSPITWIAYPVRHQDVQVLATGGGGGGGGGGDCFQKLHCKLFGLGCLWGFKGARSWPLIISCVLSAVKILLFSLK